MPRPGKWLDSAAIEADRWVDPSDAAAVDAWGTPPQTHPQAAFDPQKASRLAHAANGRPPAHPQPGARSALSLQADGLPGTGFPAPLPCLHACMRLPVW